MTENREMQKAYSQPVRVYYEDTDAGGIVYHANYLKFMERIRTDWLRSLGVEQNQLLEDSIGFVVLDMNIRFLASAKLDDYLDVSCEVIEVKRASLRLEQKITHGERLLIDAQVRIACVNTATNRAQAIPSSVLKKLA